MKQKNRGSSTDLESREGGAVSLGSSFLSYLTGDRNTNVGKSLLRKYFWRENERMKILAIFPSYVYKMDRECCSGSADKTKLEKF